MARAEQGHLDEGMTLHRGPLLISITAIAVVGIAACFATPLPTPPSVDADRISLTSHQPGSVTLVGLERSIQVEGASKLRVTGPHSWTEVALADLGSFQATLPGDVEDVFFLEAITDDEDIFLVALTHADEDHVEISDEGPDQDGDGSPDAVDCSPDDPSTAGRRCEPICTPEVEICDGIDNDCDGLVDEDCDSGLDGCDGIDNDGDGMVDEDCESGSDNDGDGFNWPEDCDDSDPAINPSASEICDGTDHNCDGLVDEECEGICSSDADCPNGTCIAGACLCDGELRSCASECVDIDSDSSHCGGCGRICNPDQSCFSGECRSD